MSTLNLKLYKSLIMETVKNETRFKAQLDRAADDKAIGAAYIEEAGDETYHERKLERSMYAGIDAVKTCVVNFLDSPTTANNITSNIVGDEIQFAIIMGSRFNSAYTGTLSGLFSKFIEEYMTTEWWKPINANLAQMYASSLELTKANIRKCFIKDAPAKSTQSYGNVTGTVQS